MPVETTDDGLWPIDDCDVQDKQRLRHFRQKRAQWVDWLKGDDEHSIRRQIRNMSASYLTWRAVKESRRIAEERGIQSAAQNGILGEFIDIGFATTQAMAVRRLMDRNPNDKKKGVVSLQRLFDDAVAHAHLFTREIFVGFNGAPYDPQPGRDRWTAKMLHGTSEKLRVSGELHAEYAGPGAWASSEKLHRLFDDLVGMTDNNRNRNDVIAHNIFNHLRNKLKSQSIKELKQLCDKRIAHAADPFSRTQSEYKHSHLSIDAVDAAHSAIIEAADFFFRIICHEPLDFAQYSIYNKFKFLDQVWLDKPGLEELRSFWKRLVEEREEWIDKASISFINIG